ncbi:MAG: hypothetical protein LBO20_10130 [Bifidobacteriaceae bacterium]|nr:hypothetical protein [Bifidobacteriaceae bacterium]
MSENTSDRIVKQAGRAARAIVEAETARPYAAPARTRRAWDNAATAHTMIDLLCEASA